MKGNFADDALLNFVKNNGGIMGTMDKELKNKIKDADINLELKPFELKAYMIEL